MSFVHIYYQDAKSILIHKLAYTEKKVLKEILRNHL